MAIDDASADRAVELWLETFSPAIDAAGKERVRAQLGPLVRILWRVIREDAVVLPGTMSADGDPVVGSGTVT